MALVSMLDDSSPEKIRKSIFVFSSIIVFSLLYKLEITAPKALFSSANGSVESVKITYEVILTVLAIFQVYLSVRLFLAWRISNAKFKKFWIMDEFEDKEDKSDLLNELNNFNKFCKANSFPEFTTKSEMNSISSAMSTCIKDALDEIGKVNSVLMGSRQNWEELSKFIYSSNQLLRTLISDKSLLSEEEQKELLEKYPHIERTKPDAQEPKFAGDLRTISEQFIKQAQEIENGELKPSLQNMEKTLGTIQPRLDALLKNIDQLENTESRYSEFVAIFPESNYKLAIDIKPSDLTKSKRIRKIELDIFEFWFPITVAFISLILCSAPYIPCVDAVIGNLSECLSVTKQS